MKKPKAYPGDEARERHLSFIRANFEALAAECYKGFIRYGRGILIINEADLLNRPGGQFTEFKLAYMAEGNDVFKAAGGKWPGGNENKEAGWVHGGTSGYDPETTVLIAFARSDGGISSYRIQGIGGGTPLHAYNRAIGKNN